MIKTILDLDNVSTLFEQHPSKERIWVLETMALSTVPLVAVLWSALLLPNSAFLVDNKTNKWTTTRNRGYNNNLPKIPSQHFLFDKIFEEEGMLGKGITVGKISVALRSSDRSDTSIFGLLESHASDDSDANEDLARMANNVCLDLMRKSDDWVAACSTSKWFSGNDSGKAESYYNDLANNEAVKFEKVRRNNNTENSHLNSS
jgi:Protein of unknown function (DUF1517)